MRSLEILHNLYQWVSSSEEQEEWRLYLISDFIPDPKELCRIQRVSCVIMMSNMQELAIHIRNLKHHEQRWNIRSIQ